VNAFMDFFRVKYVFGPLTFNEY